MWQNSNMSSSTIILKIGELKMKIYWCYSLKLLCAAKKNPKFRQLSFYDGNYDNVFKNIVLDYYQSELTYYSVANMLSYQYSTLL